MAGLFDKIFTTLLLHLEKNLLDNSWLCFWAFLLVVFWQARTDHQKGSP